jgi:hypothetical protein
MRLACWRSRPRVRELSVLSFLPKIRLLSCRSCFGRNYFGATPKSTRGTRALPRRKREAEYFLGAAPGQSETGAAVAVVVNDGAAVAQLIAFEAYA